MEWPMTVQGGGGRGGMCDSAEHALPVHATWRCVWAGKSVHYCDDCMTRAEGIGAAMGAPVQREAIVGSGLSGETRA